MLSTIAKYQEPTEKFYASLTLWGGALLLLGLRLDVAYAFFKGGLTKLSSWENTLFLFEYEYSVPLLPPEFAAYMGTVGELLFPVLLFIGIVSRPAAVGLFFVNVMAVISYPALFDFTCTAAINDHITWGMQLLVVAVFGPGLFSADHVIGKLIKR